MRSSVSRARGAAARGVVVLSVAATTLVLGQGAAGAAEVTGIEGEGLAAQGTTRTFTITGTDMSTTVEPDVTVEGAGVTVDDVGAVSSTELSVTVTVAADAAIGPRTITVTHDPDSDPDPDDCTDCLQVADDDGVTPAALGAGAVGEVTISGTGFDAGTGTTSATLVRGGAEIAGTDIEVALGGGSVTVDFDLTSAEPGIYAIRLVVNGSEVWYGDEQVGGLTVNAAPTASSISPTHLEVGATDVPFSVTGTGFVEGATVDAGDGVTVVVSDVNEAGTGITGTATVAGDATPGSRSVTVTNPDGGTSSPALTLTIFADPAVTSITPSTASRGNDDLAATIVGTGFAEGATVTFEGAGISGVETEFVSDTELTVTFDVAPDAALGARDVTVTNADTGSGTLTDGLTIISGPIVTSIEPSNVQAGTQEFVTTITGSEFVEGATVTFDSADITDVTTDVVSATVIEVSFDVAADAAPGGVDVTVTNPDTGSTTATGGITIVATPEITAVTPTDVAQGATDLPISITGTGFAEGATVTVSGTGITISGLEVNEAGTEITGLLDAAGDATLGARDLTVTNPDTGTVTDTGALTVVAAPTITSVAPGSVARGEESELTVTGTGFPAGLSTDDVVVGGDGVTLTAVTRDSATQLTLTVEVDEDAAGGARSLTVTDDATGGTATSATAFSVIAPTDLGGLTGFSPAIAPLSGGRFIVAVRGIDDALWVRTWTGTTYTPFTRVGGTLTSAPAIVSTNGTNVLVYVRGGDGAVWGIASADGTSFGSWSSFGGFIVGAPAVASWDATRVDLFARGLDNALFHRAFSGSDAGPWERLGGQLSQAPSAISTAPNRIDAVVVGSDAAAYHIAWTGAAWTAYTKIGGVIIAAPAMTELDGDAVMAVRGFDSEIYLASLDTTWSPFTATGVSTNAGIGLAGEASAPLDMVFNDDQGGVGHVESFDGSTFQ